MFYDIILFDSCTEWVPEERPSLPSILTSLSDLQSHPQPREAEPQGAGPPRARLEHQDSLGVVFLSATDSADLMEQDSSLAQLAQQNLAPPTSNATPPAPLNATPSHPSDLSREKTSSKTAVSKGRKMKKRGQLDDSTLNMTLRVNPMYSSVDEESERTSLNMAVATQLAVPRAPPPGPRKKALGEGSAPWPHYVTSQQGSPRAHSVVEDEETRPHTTSKLAADTMLARDMQAQLNQAQLEADRELAEQLQMKENSFMLPPATNPKATPTSIFPPQPLLNSIKSKMFPRLKHVETTPTQAPPTESSLKKKLGSLIPRSLSRTPPSSRNNTSTPEVVATPPSKMAPRVKSREPPSYHAYQNIGGFSHYHEYTTPPVERHVVGASAAVHPPPPPPPPPAVRKHQPSPRQLMLKDIQAHSSAIARRLRPVQTVEKRAFRVGRCPAGQFLLCFQHVTAVARLPQVVCWEGMTNGEVSTPLRI